MFPPLQRSHLSSPCTYRVCPLENVCRIRVDLTTFVIAGPGAKSDADGRENSIGRCNIESMSITSPGMKPPPGETLVKG